MKPIALIFFVFLCCFSTIEAKIQITETRCENRVNPIGIDEEIPRFTWGMVSDKRDVRQIAYQIRVSKDPRFRELVWDSKTVNDRQSVLVEYQGEPLSSNTRYYWQVRVWDNQGQSSGWGKTAFFHTGYFSQNDWEAKWIGSGEERVEDLPSPYFRKEFSSPDKIKSAMLFMTARGMYQAFLNGRKIGDEYLSPGWTAYQSRIPYQVYDLTGQIQRNNAVGVVLGDGWHSGFIGFSGQRSFYGNELSFLFELVITYEDGRNEKILSDDSWHFGTGPIKSSDIYNGETFDARNAIPGWNQTGFDMGSWSKAKIIPAPEASLVATYNEPIRKRETFKPVEMLTTPKGEKVLDFGQNLVGWVHFNIQGNEGDQIKISHAEILDKEGNFYTENLRAAKAEVNYILKGGEKGSYEPSFTFFGFRYIRIEGYEGEINPDDFTAIALYSDMELTGEFSSSNPLIDQLQQNIQWGQRGNFLDVPTDCPQRDERLGWTGDAQAFSRTAAFNFNVHSFFRKWLKDLALDQNENGAVPFVIPNVLGEGAAGSAGWADAATIIPWDMYLVYGDKRILKEQYPSMKKWMEFMYNKSQDNLWNTGFHFGDWLFYRPDDDNDGRAAVTDKYLIAQCFFAHSTQILIKSAEILDIDADILKYSQLLEDIKSAFLKEYVTPNGRLLSGTQTAYVLALHFDMLPENLRHQAAERLVENIKSYGHLTTGFLGTPYLNHVLSRFGYDDLAFELLLREKYPSWLYPVTMGATTIWERWDGIKPNGDVQTPNMNSYNHYAYGAIGDWMYQKLAGIQLDEEFPGYEKFLIRPVVGGGFQDISASLKTYYGTIESSWKQEEGAFRMQVNVPVNNSATIWIPTSSEKNILEGGKSIDSQKGIQILAQTDDFVKLEVGSGKFSFEVK